MAQKFNIVIEIKDGKFIPSVFSKADAHKARDVFTELRNEGKEAYLFFSPLADKYCKSAEQFAASVSKEKEVKNLGEQVKDFMTTAKSLAKPKAKADEPKSKDDLSI